MAGIGFKIKRVLSQGFLTLDVGAFFYAVIATAGPWIISSIYMLIITIFIKSPDPYFLGVVIYSFIFSMVLSGGLSFLLTRFVSDLFYEKNYDAIYKNYAGAMVLTISLSLLISGFFYVLNPYYTKTQIFLGMMTFTLLSSIWVQMIFVGATGKFEPVIYGFLSGFSVATVLEFYLKNTKNSLLISIVIGLGIILYIQNVFIVQIFRKKRKGGFSFEFLKNIRKYPENIFIGFFYYIGVWIDDLIAWRTLGSEIAPGFFFLKNYDMAMFLSYLFIIPAMSLFVLQVETEFYTEYRKFYAMLEKSKPLDQINTQFNKLKSAMEYSIRSIVSLQISMMVMGLLMSKPFMNTLGFDEKFLYIFRWGIIGASVNLIFLTLMLLALYFDFRRLVLQSTLITLASNLILSYIFIERFPGMSFTLSFIIASIFLAFKFRIKDLLFVTYSGLASGLIKSEIVEITFKRSRKDGRKKKIVP